MNSRATSVAVITVIIFAAILALVPMMMYIVDEGEQAVVLRFGNPVAARTESGLYFKTPFIERVERLPRTAQYWGVDYSNVLRDAQTKEGKKVNVTPWAVWKITNPQQFLQQFQILENGEARVAEVVRATIRDVITNYELHELIRTSNRKPTFTFGQDQEEQLADDQQQPAQDGQQTDDSSTIASSDQQERLREVLFGREEILTKVFESAQIRLARSISRDTSQEETPSSQVVTGDVIELVDVGISRIEFADQVQAALFARQRARMEALSAKYDREGEEKKREIINQAKADAEAIRGEGRKIAQELVGEARAFEIEQDAKALKQMGEFYFFVRKLEAYKKGLAGRTKVILSTDNEFLNLLEGLKEFPPPATSSSIAGTNPSEAPTSLEDPSSRNDANPETATGSQAETEQSADDATVSTTDPEAISTPARMRTEPGPASDPQTGSY